MPTKAAPPLLLPAVGEPPANPFSAKKKFGGGKSQKKAKGAAGRARPPTANRRRGSELAFCSKMGSSERVKSLQIHNDDNANIINFSVSRYNYSK